MAASWEKLGGTTLEAGIWGIRRRCYLGATQGARTVLGHEVSVGEQGRELEREGDAEQGEQG